MKIKSKTVSLLWKIPVGDEMPFYKNFIEYWKNVPSCHNLYGYVLYLDIKYTAYQKAVKKGIWIDSFEAWVEDDDPVSEEE